MFNYRHIRFRQMPPLEVFLAHAEEFSKGRFSKGPYPGDFTACVAYEHLNVLFSSSSVSDEAINEDLEQYGWVFNPQDWQLIYCDEMFYWTLDRLGEHRKWLASVGAIYLFDRNVKVHVCSPTPCYELYFVKNSFRFVDGEIPEESIEAIHQFFDDAVTDDEPVCYVNCYDIDKHFAALYTAPLGEPNDNFTHMHLGDPEFDADDINDYLDSHGELNTRKVVDYWFEWLSGNNPLD